MVILSSDKAMLKRHNITIIYAPMLKHVFGAVYKYEPIRHYAKF